MTDPALPIGYGGPMADYWATFISDGLDRYRVELTDDAVLAEVQAGPGQVILDAGCGEGYLARAMAAQGAQVVGLDLAADLIDRALAIEAADPAGVVYHVGSMTDPAPLPEASADTVVCNHSLNDIEDLDTAIKHLRHTLRPGGRLVALVLHPCFYWQRSGLSEDDPAWPARYFDTRPRLQSFTVAGQPSPGQVQAWYRPLEAYSEALAAAGLAILKLAEPHPSGVQLADPWWADNWTRPMFLLLVAGERTQPQLQ